MANITELHATGMSYPNSRHPDNDDVTFCSTPADNGPDVEHPDPHGVVLKVVYATIGTLGFLGNGLVCAIFLTQKKSFRSVTNLLILNQSIIDIFNATIFLILRLPPTIDRLPQTPLGEAVCRLWVSEYIMWALFFASNANLVLMSLERYFATCFPVRHRFHFTACKAKSGMAFSWCWGFLYQLYWLIVREFRGGSCGVVWSSPTLQKIMGIVFFLVEYLLPLGIMTFAYTSIILMLRRRGSDGRIVCSVFQRAKRNVTFTLCLVFFFYVVCWTPTEITYLLYNLGYPYDFSSGTHMVVTVLVLLNMCVNPIIYTLKYEQFQRQLRRFFCKRHWRNRIGIALHGNTARPSDRVENISQHIP